MTLVIINEIKSRHTENNIHKIYISFHFGCYKVLILFKDPFS